MRCCVCGANTAWRIPHGTISSIGCVARIAQLSHSQVETEQEHAGQAPKRYTLVLQGLLRCELQELTFKQDISLCTVHVLRPTAPSMQEVSVVALAALHHPVVDFCFCRAVGWTASKRAKAAARVTATVHAKAARPSIGAAAQTGETAGITETRVARGFVLRGCGDFGGRTRASTRAARDRRPPFRRQFDRRAPQRQAQGQYIVRIHASSILLLLLLTRRVC